MKKTIKRESLNIRVSMTEKKKLIKYAECEGMSLSDYVRAQLFCKDKKKGNAVLAGSFIVRIQEILNYVHEKYGTDEWLKRMVERLWKNIQS